jgi:hypothetical protein
MLDTLRKLFRVPEAFGSDQTSQVAAQLYTLTVILLFSACVSIAGYMLVLERFTLPILIGFAVIPVLLATLMLLRAQRVRAASITLVVGLWCALGGTAALNGGIEAPAYHGLIVVTLCAGLLLGRRAALICTIASVLLGLGFVYAEIRGVLPPYVEIGGQVGQWSTYAIYLLATGVLFNLTVGSVNGSLAEARRQVAERNQAVAQLREREAELHQALDAAQAAEVALRRSPTTSSSSRAPGCSRMSTRATRRL